MESKKILFDVIFFYLFFNFLTGYFPVDRNIFQIDITNKRSNKKIFRILEK